MNHLFIFPIAVYIAEVHTITCTKSMIYGEDNSTVGCYVGHCHRRGHAR
jgi:hypothetical protein